MSGAFEILADCPHCRLESGVLTVLDPDDPLHAQGIPAEQRCRLCGWHTVAEEDGAREVVPPGDLRSPESARVAIERFAREEGEPDTDAFCASAIGLAPAEIARRLAVGEAIPSNFDAIAWLFGASGGGGGGRAAIEDARVGEAPDPPSPPPLSTTIPPPHPRHAQRALASVMVADGVITPAERAWVAAWLHKQGSPPPSDAELRIWRPEDLGPLPPEAARALIDACVDLAHLDSEPDVAELRVIRGFARAWGLEDAWVDQQCARHDARHRTLLTPLWRGLTRLVRTR